MWAQQVTKNAEASVNDPIAEKAVADAELIPAGEKQAKVYRIVASNEPDANCLVIASIPVNDQGLSIFVKLRSTLKTAQEQNDNLLRFVNTLRWSRGLIMSSIANKSFSSREAAVGTLDFNAVLWRFLTALGSLRIAVVMFGLGTLLLFVGTLAQDQETIVDVKRHYFNSWIAYVPFDVFVPSTICPTRNQYHLGFLCLVVHRLVSSC